MDDIISIQNLNTQPLKAYGEETLAAGDTACYCDRNSHEIQPWENCVPTERRFKRYSTPPHTVQT